MNLYLISQEENNGYDTYDSCVVAAPSEAEAKLIRPDSREWNDDTPFSCWANHIENISVELIGVAAEHVLQGIVLASFNAG